jgi:lysyl-tRNA synthetase class 2
MQLNELQQTRLSKLEAARAAGADPFPARAHRTHTTQTVLDQFDTLEASREPVAVAGRIMLRRVIGGSVFAQLADGAGRIQVFLSKRDLGADTFKQFVDWTDMGDIVGAEGYAFRTKTGEPTIFVQRWQLLAKALNPLPEKWSGLTDQEVRLRQRYVDLIANEDVRQTFTTRARVISAMRRFLDEQGFIEVETPTLQPIYGGAAARPFTTHHNQLHQDLFLRIAPELYLKRLIVGGFERVYEIGKAFRNEGVDRFHNPEFTMMECYQAYADYNDMMALVEQMTLHIVQNVAGTTTITFADQTVDVSPPWPRVTMRDALGERTGIDIAATTTKEALIDEIKRNNLQVDGQPTWAKLVDELYKTYVRPQIVEPTFLIDYPQALSPLAKRKPNDPAFVERFQPIMFGAELGNAFSELNDPLDQEQRFLEQGRAEAAGDHEAMQMDRDYLNALMTGMPPTGGLGIGVDRLVMLLTNQQTIREVILFPHLRRIETNAQDGNEEIREETDKKGE